MSRSPFVHGNSAAKVCFVSGGKKHRFGLARLGIFHATLVISIPRNGDGKHHILKHTTASVLATKVPHVYFGGDDNFDDGAPRTVVESSVT